MDNVDRFLLAAERHEAMSEKFEDTTLFDVAQAVWKVENRGSDSAEFVDSDDYADAFGNWFEDTYGYRL